MRRTEHLMIVNDCGTKKFVLEFSIFELLRLKTA